MSVRYAARVAIAAFAGVTAPLIPDAALLHAQSMASPPAVRIVRAESPIKLDGHLDDVVWTTATWSDGFRQRDPAEGEPATQLTRVALAYEDDALWVAARMSSTRPAEIRAQVTRRDAESTSEQIVVSLDTYNDGRTAYSFGVTAAGVRLDYYHATDDLAQRDYAYDPVWKAATAFDAEGWTAELRIPFSQLRFAAAAADPRWGINVIRKVPARNEESHLVLVPKNQPGWASRFAPLIGLARRPAALNAELLPYVASDARLTSGRDPRNPFDDGRNLNRRMGADLRLGLRSNLTLDATVNPDFGQVEADPAEVNLTVFETNLSERRAFFTEGRQLFAGGGAQYFYSRRIGAAPREQVSGNFVDAPQSTAILGAAKLTGRLRQGLSIGALSAVTGEEHARSFDTLSTRNTSTLVQPRTAYGVLRAQQQFGQYGSTGGIVLTGVSRHLPGDGKLSAALARQAVTGGTDWTLRFRGGEYVAAFDAGFSHVTGDSTAITRLQRSSARYFQRPDADHVELDPLRQSLTGYRANLGFNRTAGRHWLWGVGAGAVSPGFELNDAGRLSSADNLNGSLSLTYRENTPGRFLRSYSVNVFAFRSWDFDGMIKRGEVPAVFADVVFKNFWTLSGHYHYAPRAWSPTTTRGGPAMRTPTDWHHTARLSGNPALRTPWLVGVNLFTDELGQRALDVNGSVAYRSGGRWELSAEPLWYHANAQRQWVAERGAGPAATYGRRYVFGALERRELAMRLRLNYSITPELSTELYAQPFVSSGRFTRFGELADPSRLLLREYGTDGTTISAVTDGYVVNDRGQAVSIPNPDFTVRSLRSNAVLRWEWRSGSTLFFVWQQDRAGHDAFARNDVVSAFGESFGLPGENRFAVKATYWLAR
ncbi:MAG: carbohydrate binding family 9 domain-containing protein [Gemmatimonadaceae bacterium]|nr:carbohydrate binding family 9 domain-containing protein [Gemmatimonadaceae bacterium]